MSKGLSTPLPPRLSTWVQVMVVPTSLWPSSSWIVRIVAGFERATAEGEGDGAPVGHRAFERGDARPLIGKNGDHDGMGQGDGEPGAR